MDETSPITSAPPSAPKLSFSDIREALGLVIKWRLEQVFSEPIHKERWTRIGSGYTYSYTTPTTWYKGACTPHWRVKFEWNGKDYIFLAEVTVCPMLDVR